jgi:hypothetical protein
MARTPAPRIIEWGTPPTPRSAWDLIKDELDRRPGKWANIGTVSKPTVLKNLPSHDGYEHSYVKDADRPLVVWVRKGRTS